MKKAQSNNDHIGEALLLLMGFSVALGAEIKSIGVNINKGGIHFALVTV
jgi:hypothetical protein